MMRKQKATKENIHDLIEEWHDLTNEWHDFQSIPSLHEYLGLTWEQCKHWAETDKLPNEYYRVRKNRKVRKGE